MQVLERIRRQASLIEEFLKELEYEKSYRGVERLIQLAIQAVLDLGLMVISALGGRKPRSYSDIGYILAELGIIGEEEARLLKSLAGLRNVLVHAYAYIDREKVLKFSKDLRVDIPRLVQKVLGSVEAKNLDPVATNVNEVVERLRDVLRGRVLIAFLYGGRARGYELKGDYDIAVYMEPQCNLYKLGELVIDIAKALDVPEESVDLVCLDMLPPEHVIEALDGVPIVVEDETKLLELRYKALAKFLDIEESMRIAEERLRS